MFINQFHNFALEICTFIFYIVKCCKFNNPINFSESASDFIKVPFPVVQFITSLIKFGFADRYDPSYTAMVTSAE